MRSVLPKKTLWTPWPQMTSEVKTNSTKWKSVKSWLLGCPISPLPVCNDWLNTSQTQNWVFSLPHLVDRQKSRQSSYYRCPCLNSLFAGNVLCQTTSLCVWQLRESHFGLLQLFLLPPRVLRVGVGKDCDVVGREGLTERVQGDHGDVVQGEGGQVLKAVRRGVRGDL